MTYDDIIYYLDYNNTLYSIDINNNYKMNIVKYNIKSFLSFKYITTLILDFDGNIYGFINSTKNLDYISTIKDNIDIFGCYNAYEGYILFTKDTILYKYDMSSNETCPLYKKDNKLVIVFNSMKKCNIKSARSKNLSNF